MTKKLLSVIIAFVAVIPVFQASAQEPEAYAVLRDSTLTFYFDTQRENFGFSFDVPKKAGWSNMPLWTENAEGVKNAVFTESFVNFVPLTMTSWFEGCSNLQFISGLENVNTDSVTNMYDLFYDCGSLKTIDLSSLNTENVTDMSYMFSGCSSLTNLDLSHFNTGKVTDMSYMLAECSKLTEVNLENLNTGSLKNVTWMFQKCAKLKTIYCDDDWSIISGINGYKMFNGCVTLEGAVKYDSANTGIEMANPETGYFTKKSSTAIGNVIATKAIKQGVTYNINGQVVGDDHKGVVIKDGKKIFQQ